MPPTGPANDKILRQQARQHADAADAAFASGDYAAAMRLCLTAVQLGPDTAVGHKSMQRVNLLSTDPWAMQIGLMSTALYGVAWLYALYR